MLVNSNLMKLGCSLEGNEQCSVVGHDLYSGNHLLHIHPTQPNVYFFDLLLSFWILTSQ